MPHNFAVEQTAGSQPLARGCSPRRFQAERVVSDEIQPRRHLIEEVIVRSLDQVADRPRAHRLSFRHQFGRPGSVERPLARSTPSMRWPNRRESTSALEEGQHHVVFARGPEFFHRMLSGQRTASGRQDHAGFADCKETPGGETPRGGWATCAGGLPGRGATRVSVEPLDE